MLTGAVPPGHGGAVAQTPVVRRGGSPAPDETRIGAAARIEPLRPGFEFPNGQTLHYEADWRFWTAGIASFRFERVGSQEHIAGAADSTGVVALLYRVQDRFNSYFDAKTLCSSKLMQAHRRGVAFAGNNHYL